MVERDVYVGLGQACDHEHHLTRARVCKGLVNIVVVVHGHATVDAGVVAQVR